MALVELVADTPRGHRVERCPYGSYTVGHDHSIQADARDLETLISRGYYPRDPLLYFIVKGIVMKGFFSEGARPTLSGTLSADGYSASFKPALNLPIYVLLKGTYQGRVTVLRSIDGGVTKQARAVSADGYPPTAGFGNDGGDGMFLELPPESSPEATYYVYFDFTSGTVEFKFNQ